MISDYDRHLFNEGTHFRSYRFLGAHACRQDGVAGWTFAVWAPNARRVSVVGDFNSWQGCGHRMRMMRGSGIWQLFIPGLSAGELYKYEITAKDGTRRLKADPCARHAELRPGTASRLYDEDGYAWRDGDWQERRRAAGLSIQQPLAVYEVHLGSWRRKPGGGFYSYRELAGMLPAYVAEMGFTHVELLPLAEHPYDGSWGYQATGYFAPTSRYGGPAELKGLIDEFHRQGIGVILDWVPGHFGKDDHGLRLFDGTALYESGYSQLAENRDWGTLNFDFCRPQVWSFLISNALYWLEVFHIDGLRVDAVANMVYRDYGKKEGEWLPNRHGGRENLEAVAFLKKLNEAVHQYYPQAQVIAEESTTWPSVTKPVYLGGLGFDYKWNMGWMNDILKYMACEPGRRAHVHNLLTFSLMYAFSENFLLPLSHDEVVHGKKSLLDKMPGDYWQKFAGLRAFYGYFMAHPGKKLLFMGGEFGQFIEWNEQQELDWLLLDFDLHRRLRQWVRDLNHYYRANPPLWQEDTDWRGFEWIDCQDAEQSMISFLRKTRSGAWVIAVCNFTPTVRHGYQLGVPAAGVYREVLNSDERQYGGSGQSNTEVVAQEAACHGRRFSITIMVPPLSTVYWQCVPQREEEAYA
ncbi:MAG TPA: 1,4-alpha-glucan branching protein GlgB [Selenomonadales bacterium]|nr:1,4-alpha-glucan branching protein GlgB [Selenomonadales bacterium]